jgi:putative iron-dependent peroxidase
MLAGGTMSAQSGILPPSSPYARFLVIRLKDLPVNGLKRQVQVLEATRERLQVQYPEAGLVSVIAFGAALWMELRNRGPKELRPLAPVKGKFTMPATGGDIFLHVRSARADLCFALQQAFLLPIAGEVEVLEEVSGFRYMDKRDLTGFIDGSENPRSDEERAEAALIGTEDKAYAGGSYVFTQRYLHHLGKWNRLKVDTQEQVIGRSKLESIEMSDEEKPENSHVARTVIEEDGEELAILRQGLPYSSGTEAGLFFLAYTRSPQTIDKMLARMFGTTDDGISDRLLNFVTPVSGAYFFAPAQELLETVMGTG